jgi:hypothetical protein
LANLEGLIYFPPDTFHCRFQNDLLLLKTGESFLIEDDNTYFEDLEISDVVLFITDKDSTYFKKGMYSGNQK